MRDGLSEPMPTKAAEKPGEKKARKKGQKMSQEERQALAISELLGNLTKFIRRDFGGKENQVAVVAKKARVWAAKQDLQFTDAGYEKLAEFAMEFAGDQLEGCRTRTADTVAELKRRLTLLEKVHELIGAGETSQAWKLIRKIIDGSPVAATTTLF